MPVIIFMFSQRMHYVFGLSVCCVHLLVCLFVLTDLITTVSCERLEQSRWNLQWIFTSPYWRTGDL